MTYSNGYYNPNPFANPFNTRLGPSNFTYNQCSQSYKTNANINHSVKLPDPIMLVDMHNAAQSNLTPPNQLDYARTGPQIDRIALSMKYKNSYVDPNGTVYDLDTRKIIFQANDNHGPNEWNTCKIISFENPNGDWNNSEIYRLDNNAPNSLQIDAVSQQYWNQVEQSKTQEMTDLQKELMADLEAGKFVGVSRLVDDV